MQVFINGFELNHARNRVYLKEPIEGLEIPAIRTSKGTRTGSHGGYFGKQLYDMRAITLQGRIFADTLQDALKKRRQIQEALPLYPEPIELRIVDEDGAHYTINCQLIDFQMPVDRFRRTSAFKIDLEAADVHIYDVSSGASLHAVIRKAMAGGLLFSSSSPVFGYNFYFTGGSGNTVIHNPTNMAIAPTIVISGQTSDPVIINRTTSQKFEMLDYDTGPGSVTQIDLQARTVRLGAESQLVDGLLPKGAGTGQLGYVPLSSQWWVLAPGDNEIVFESGRGTDVREADVYWRPAYVGI